MSEENTNLYPQEVENDSKPDYLQVLPLFEEISKLRTQPFYHIAADMAYIMDNVELEEPLTDLTAYILATKLDEAGGSWFTQPLLHDERLDAIRYMLEYGLNENHSPEFTVLSPEDTLKLLLSADISVFGTLVETVAIDNQVSYAIEDPPLHQDVAAVNKVIEKFQDRDSLTILVQKAFENKGKKNYYSSGPYSVGFEDRAHETLFEVCYNRTPVLSGNTFDKEVQLCTSQDVHPYDDLIFAVVNALPEYHLGGEIFEGYIGDPETDMKYARYFCGDFDGVISKEEYEKIRDSGDEAAYDTVDYEPIFDGKIYPTMADSSVAQINAFGYHYDDDRRAKPSLNDQIRAASSKADASSQNTPVQKNIPQR